MPSRQPLLFVVPDSLYSAYSRFYRSVHHFDDEHARDYVNLLAQFKFSVASPRGANQKMVQHDTG